MKKFVLGLAAMALIFASCSKDEVTGVNDQNPDVIGFFSSTSRATINNLAALQSDASGFKVFGTSGSSPSAWYANVAGSNYGFASSAWGWKTTNATWPTVVADYPMNFYAMYPATHASVVLSSTYPTVSGAVTIPAAASAQADLLAATASTTTKPGDGKLALTFKHILSKVNFGIIAGYEKSVIVQTIGVKNVSSKGTYNYVTGAWSAIGTDAAFDYFRNTTTPFNVTGSDAAETAATPIYTGGAAASANLMLMPQTHTTWNKSTTVANSYVELIYRLTATGLPNSIGYTNATNYLTDYTGYVDGTDTWGSYTGISTGGTPYGAKPLFIKVGFPMDATSFTWASGKGYTYNIGLGTLGSCNGFYTDDTYYDENGDDTGIPIIGPDGTPVEPGDPVSDDILHFLVNVTDWDDTTAPVVLP